MGVFLILLFVSPFFSFPLSKVYPEQRKGIPGKAVQQLPLKIGVASMITPLDSVRYYQDIVDYIGKKLGMPVQMVYRLDYADMDHLLKKGAVDVAFICSGPYVNDHDRFGAQLLAAPVVNNRLTYNSYVIVNKSSHIKSFADLKGKTFAFTDPRSNSGRLYVAYRLSKMHYTSQTFFKRYVYSYSHNKSVEMVAKGQVDGASVDSLVYNYMLKKHSQYAALTKVIEKSPPFGTPPVVINTNVGKSLKKRIRAILLDMNKDLKGRSILAAMMIDRFRRVSDSDYNFVRGMEDRISEGSGVARKKGVIYFGVIPRDNPRIEYEKYQPLLDYLSKETHYRFELVLRKSYEDTVTDMGNGTIDMAFLGPITYLEAHKKYGAYCLLRPGGAYYRSVIIARKDSPFRAVSDLNGKSFAFGAVGSTAGDLVPHYLLASSGITKKNLSAYANFDYDESVAKAVLSGQYDAGAVRNSSARKFCRLGLEIIGESEPIPAGPIVIGPKVPIKVAEAVKKALERLNTGKHREVLRDMGLRQGFVRATENDYAGICKKVCRGCVLGAHPKIKL
ncbi:MAG: phosphate/phosphite/phosphonate ABC transporter substrate-binding protein [Nitrospiraceae bacterium]|nr:phosphate/phosphite/phosphonate ABC transporter substrate-binding protein [Nitrospiraceae bacterium]